MIGINNRDLRTFEVSLETTFGLLPDVPAETVLVSESGIAAPHEVARLAAAGVDAILVGEGLLRHADVAQRPAAARGDRMTRVKICGITSAEDAAAAVDAGADALGLVFVPGTPRYVPPDAAAGILAAVPPFVATVGVFVDHPLEEVLRIVAALGLHAVQLHGEEPAAYSRRIPVPVIRAIRVRDADEPPAAGDVSGARVPAGRVRGGAFPAGPGRPFRWTWRCRRKAGRRSSSPVGLRPETVSQAVRLVRPYGVDVSSGVEASPGRKDHRKVREFIADVRQADLG